MTAKLNEAATCFVFTWNEKMVAFESILPLPNGSYKNAYREHRLVVLPDFQGLGLGIKISEWCGGILLNDRKTFYTKTVNPALGLYRQKSHNWEATAANGKSDKQEHIDKCSSMGGLTRPSYCFKYVGEPISGFEDLLLPIDKVRYNNSMKGQLSFNFE